MGTYAEALEVWSDACTELFTSEVEQGKLELAYEISRITLELYEAEQDSAVDPEETL